MKEICVATDKNTAVVASFYTELRRRLWRTAGSRATKVLEDNRGKQLDDLVDEA